MNPETFTLPFENLLLKGSTFGTAPRLLSLHGGGTARHTGVSYLLRPLAEAGLPGAAFDFSGHGDSGGTVQGSGLAHRLAQALAVARHLAMQPPVALIGTSMGGHVACRLIEHLQPQALVLFCPAAYSAEAEAVPFGPAFRQVLHGTTDFGASPAFDALEKFEGRLLLVFGDEDTVIPQAVQRHYADRARKARSVETIRLRGAPHRLHGWLDSEANAAQRQHVTDRMRATLAG